MANQTISAQNSNIQNTNGAKKASTKITSNAKSRIQASFAAVMAKEQSAADKSAEKTQTEAKKARPQVARLPEPGIPLNGGTVLAGRSPNDMKRMQAYTQGASQIKNRAIEGYLRGSSNMSAMDIARSKGEDTNLKALAAGGNGVGFALTSNDFIRTRKSNASGVSRTSRIRSKKNRPAEEMGLGKLSARFESGGDGIAAIGYDRNGGTSYGKYQIASRVGSMNAFLSFLDAEAPDLAKRLRQAGPANTGSRSGKMPNEWRAIAKEQPERFEQLQESYIHQSHYKPALDAIGEKTGLDASTLSAAMREVIWSTAVQHGPAGATRIFAQADNMSGSADNPGYERKMITNVYKLRAGQFGSSTTQVREAVQNRFRQEKQMALNMLENPSKASLA